MYFHTKNDREECIDNIGLARPGEQVVFKECSDCQVTYGGHDDPRDHLLLDSIYIVKNVIIKEWSSQYELEGFEELGFNTVCFEKVKGVSN